MNWNTHLRIKNSDAHAFLGASKYSWLNYDEDKLKEAYNRYKAKELGTKLHDLACKHIQLGIYMPNDDTTFNCYVNDAIDYNMTPEQVLYYSDNCFGTADSILFLEDDNLLRIHDLKTGTTKASMNQLYIYAALFCLEYDVKPGDIEYKLRIYQNNKIIKDSPSGADILPIMDKIIRFDKYIRKIKEAYS